jgi:hypothetical protein
MKLTPLDPVNGASPDNNSSSRYLDTPLTEGTITMPRGVLCVGGHPFPPDLIINKSMKC